MEHFETIKIGVDVLLVLSVIGLALGFGRKSSGGLGLQAGRITELATMLKALVKQADSSGRSLNDQLMKRRAEMEKLLYEIETVEHRINKSITTAEESRSLLEIDTEKFKSRAPARYEEPAPRPAYTEERESMNYSVSHDSPASLNPQDSYSASYSSGQYAPVEQAPKSSFTEPASFGENTYTYAPATRAKSSGTNIYGEPVGAEAAPQAAYGLSNQMEKSREVSQRDKGFSESMQDIYEVAENLLSAGIDIRSVAARTKLPADEIQMLARMVKQEHVSRAAETPATEDTTSTANDPRLGVLGGMRRTRQTL